MNNKVPLLTIWRFPLIFAGFLSVVGFALFNKEKWLGDIQAQRQELYKETESIRQNNMLLEELKKTHGKAKV